PAPPAAEPFLCPEDVPPGCGVLLPGPAPPYGRGPAAPGRHRFPGFSFSLQRVQLPAGPAEHAARGPESEAGIPLAPAPCGQVDGHRQTLPFSLPFGPPPADAAQPGPVP